MNSSVRLSQFDPSGEVDLADAAAVESRICAILDRQYAGRYDLELLRSAMADVVRAYRGHYPGLLRCDALYHDLRHALETGLTTTRILDGYATDHPPSSATGIDADRALLGVLLALFHDIGLLRRDSEADLWGPVLTPVHEERGVEFMQAYLSQTTLSSHAGVARLIMATKLIYEMPDSWTEADRTLAMLIATSDLVSQLADRDYLEKCRDFLFLEFSAFGLAGKPNSPYPDSQTLLRKTPEFVEGFLKKRLNEDFQGVRRYLRVHMHGADPWQDAQDRNISFLKTLLESQDLDLLRRNPMPYVGE